MNEGGSRMMNRLLKILVKAGVSVGSIFLGMYLVNIGLGFANASDDLLVVMGTFITIGTVVAMIWGNAWLWKNELNFEEK